ncbi:dethiobiotin synthase [Lichenicoccus sp.]|uniref:dethiobiotin synthase n=1 Tax=Lichenicoccus sp. TaxID=2781899 RepID=UPI003D107606
MSGLTADRAALRRGVFVTGTDTNVGKTLVAACLVRAWQAVYWKPLQTGLAEQAGDSETVMRLAGIGAERVVPPHTALQAPLSPYAAAALENAVIDLACLRLPSVNARPLVVEGAGGLLVPVNETAMMIDLIGQLGLPVVLVARGTLGTINHTLLSLEALRNRGLAVAGVVISGPVLTGNRETIVHHGDVRILAELPWAERLDAASVMRLARLIPPLADIIGADRVQ